MGLLTSLLCCGGEANDSADDKYKQVPNRVSLKEHINRSSASIAAAKVAAQSIPTLSETTKSSAMSKVAAHSAAKRNSLNTGETLTASGSNTKSKRTSKTNSTFSNDDQLHNNQSKSARAKGDESSSPVKKSSADDTKATNKPDGSEKDIDATANTTDHTHKSEDVATRDDSWVNDDEELKKDLDDSSLDNEDDASASRATIEDDGNDFPQSEVIEEEEEEELTDDLTKIQEGQAFNPETGMLLGKKDVARFGNKKCLILDLDETLVHSSFKYLRTADFVIPVEIDNQVHHVYVIKRPGVDEFLKKVGQWYEVVVFTASVAKYGDPLLNKLDISEAVHHRLFRDSCFSYQGNFIKNLSQIGRPLADSIIIDNSPASYIFHPQHSVPISSWFSDTHDNELLDLLPLLEDLSKPNVSDVSLVLDITI